MAERLGDYLAATNLLRDELANAPWRAPTTRTMTATLRNASSRSFVPALVAGSKSHMSAHVSGSLGGLLDTTKEALEGALKAATIYSEGFQTVQAVYNIPFLHNGL